MTRFNLLDDPWITCLVEAGDRTELLGIHDVLTRAHAVRSIAEPSPLTGVAIHRLLLAMLHRMFGPATAADWEAIWRAGTWDAAHVESYAARWRRRFDLFDDAHPFYQSRSLDPIYATPIAGLAHELASGNNPTLFDHTYEAVRYAVAPDQAARYLLAHQAFALGGLLSFEKGQDRGVYGSATAAPLVNGVVSMVQGETLFATLMLNLVRYNQDDEVPFAMQTDDMPAWERDEETRPEVRYPRGYLDLLTWQSRRIRLLPERDGLGNTVVRRVVRMKGNQFPPEFSVDRSETMQAFGKNAQAKPGQPAWYPVSFKEDRGLWRDSLALFQSVAESQRRPKILDWVQQLVDGGILSAKHTLPLSISGLAADRAKALFWRQEQMPLPLAYLTDEDLLDHLREALQVAEDVGRLFLPGFTVEVVAGEKQSTPRPFHLLGQALAAPSDARKPDPQDIRNIVEQLAPGRAYWSRLEPIFTNLLFDLANEMRDREHVERLQETGNKLLALTSWVVGVRQAARGAFQDTTRSLNNSARSLKAVACAERAFRGQLARILNPYGVYNAPRPLGGETETAEAVVEGDDRIGTDDKDGQQKEEGE